MLDAYTNSTSEIDRTELLEKMNSELDIFLSKVTNETDSVNGIFAFLKDLSDSVQEEFLERLTGDSDKKSFVRALPRIFALLLNTKVGIPKKIKRIIKIAIETPPPPKKKKKYGKTKATVRRLPVQTRHLPRWLVNGEHGKKKKNNLPAQVKRNTTRTKNRRHYQREVNNKNNKCEKKIQVF